MDEILLSYYGVQVHLVDAAATGLCSRLQEMFPDEGYTPAATDVVSVSYEVTASTAQEREQEPHYAISRDGVEVLSSATEEVVFQQLWRDIHCTVAERNQHLVFVPAGVVGWRGLAIVIIGTGKSSLVAELVRRGAVYHSDTFAVLDAAGRVHPYVRPVTLDPRGRQPANVRVEGEEVPAAALPIGLVVAGGYRAGVSWRPAVVRGARALWPLFGELARQEAERVTEFAGWIASTVVTLQGPWADAEDVAARLLDLVDDAFISHASAASSNGTRHLSEDLARVAELRAGSVSPQPAQFISPGPAAKRLVAIVTPIHRFTLSADEQISLRHLRAYLGRFDRYLIGPHSPPEALADFVLPPYTARYFADRPGYSRLLVTEEFYRAFADYEYILIYQLDCLVFSDELEAWCRQGWDYIGAPWFHFWHPYQYANSEYSEDPIDRFGTVGNGGFSLRKVESALAVLNSSKQQLRDRLLGRFRSDPHAHEDMFWSYDALQLMDGFRIPRPRQALEFSFEAAPRYCFHENAARLPFGCHAWTWFEREFWEPFLLK